MKGVDYSMIEFVYGNFSYFQRSIVPVILANSSDGRVRILEIGCGTAITSKIILSAKMDIELTIIDHDIEMLNVTQNELSESKNISFHNTDALEFLMENSEKYHFVISGYTIHNFTRSYRENVYCEIFRSLKPMGVFINADKFASDNQEKQLEALKYRIGTYVDTLLPLGKFELLKYWIAHYVDDQHPDKILKFNETEEILEAIGFCEISYIFRSEREMLGVLTARKPLSC